MSVSTALIGLAVLGLMVIVHEWGHYAAARYFKIRVVTFSVGFGPRLFGLRRGDTDYCVRAFPLGGYVKMAGDNLFEGREGKPDEFYSKPRWQRSVVAFAGPAVNILLAVVLLAGLYKVHYERPAYRSAPPVLAGVVPDSPAAKAGLQAGDKILAVNGESIPDWETLDLRTLLTSGDRLPVKVQRGEQQVELVVTPEEQDEYELAYVGWIPRTSIVFQTVAPGMPAERAGLQPGDEILKLNGEPVEIVGPRSLPEQIRESAGEPIRLTIRRGEDVFQKELRAEKTNYEGSETYLIGIGNFHLKTQVIQLGFGEAIRESVSQNWTYIELMGTLLRRMITGQSSLSSVQGPIGITVLAGQMARLGWGPLLGLMAAISINLGALNLLPIPILDGGHIAMFAVEGALRRDLSLQLKERFLQLGFVVLMLLFAVVMYNDIVRYFFQ